MLSHSDIRIHRFHNDIKVQRFNRFFRIMITDKSHVNSSTSSSSSSRSSSSSSSRRSSQDRRLSTFPARSWPEAFHATFRERGKTG